MLIERTKRELEMKRSFIYRTVDKDQNIGDDWRREGRSWIVQLHEDWELATLVGGVDWRGWPDALRPSRMFLRWRGVLGVTASLEIILFSESSDGRSSCIGTTPPKTSIGWSSASDWKNRFPYEENSLSQRLRSLRILISPTSLLA